MAPRMIDQASAYSELKAKIPADQSMNPVTHKKINSSTKNSFPVFPVRRYNLLLLRSHIRKAASSDSANWFNSSNLKIFYA